MAGEGTYSKKGKCPECGRVMGLTGGGNMPPHNDTSKRDSAGFHPECPGTGRKPA